MCLCEISYMKVPTCTCNHWRVMNVTCGSVLNCSIMLFKDQKTNRVLLHKILTLHRPRINVFTYNGSPLMTRLKSLVGLFFKAIAATGMHWTSAERTAPLNAPSLTESTKQTLKEGEGVWERSLPTVQLIQMGLGFSFSLQLQYFDAYTAFWKGKRDGREVMTSSSIIKVRRGWDTEQCPPSQHLAAQQ